MNVTWLYEQTLKERGYTADAAQLRAVERLQQCHDEWTAYKEKRSNALKKLINKPQIPRGVYMWGGVGRGKSFLMDCFFSAVPLQRKTRLHFHEFMREVHGQLEELKGQQNPLEALAFRIAKRYRLICFDEFHVSDIADAMILYRLLDGLFRRGVSIVTTSNYQPDTLYPDGLHRDRVLPAIALIKQHMDVINVDAGVDYRKRTLEQVQAYITPLSKSADEQLAAVFERIAEAKDEDPVLHIEHRELRAKRRAGGVVWFDFKTLCDGPRSQNDYLEIATRFHTVILSEVPAMSPRLANAARRFTWLVDVFYDRRVKLIVSAEVPAEALYTEGAMVHEFARTVSRLTEMQSKEFLEQERRDVVTALA
jgi:cell division protein ZapE